MITDTYLHDPSPFNGPFFMTPPFSESQKNVTLPLFPPPSPCLFLTSPLSAKTGLLVQSQESAEIRPRSNFPESKIHGFSKEQSAKLNTDETFLPLAQNILAKPQFNHAITYLSTPCGNHTITAITHFRVTGKTVDNHA